MAREIDSSSEVDPNLVAAVAGRSKGTRDGDARVIQRGKKDKFHVPKDMIPKGWCVEWKRKSCLGKEEEADYFMDLDEAGWKIAPVSQFPKLMPADYQGKTVERGGMILMMRPEKLQNAAKKLLADEAKDQVKDKLMEIGMTGKGEMKRVVNSFDRKYDREGIDVPQGDE